MNKINKLVLICLTFLLVMACKEEVAKRKGRFNFDAIKAELSLTEDQASKFDSIIDKYTKIREASFAASKENGKMNRSVMMKKMQTIMKSQNEEVLAILNPDQLPVYQKFAKKMMQSRRSGYSDEDLLKITTTLALDSTQTKMLNAVNKAFEKSYSDAHDYYHGNSELAKEYWNKYDLERKKALKIILTEEQNAKYLEIVNTIAFKGEH